MMNKLKKRDNRVLIIIFISILIMLTAFEVSADTDLYLPPEERVTIW